MFNCWNTCSIFIFQFSAQNRASALGASRFTNETSLQQSNRLLANLDKGEGLSSNLIDAGTVKVNSDNINTFQNSAIAIGGSGAFDIRDNLGKQIQGFGT